MQGKVLKYAKISEITKDPKERKDLKVRKNLWRPKDLYSQGAADQKTSDLLISCYCRSDLITVRAGASRRRRRDGRRRGRSRRCDPGARRRDRD